MNELFEDKPYEREVFLEMDGYWDDAMAIIQYISVRVFNRSRVNNESSSETISRETHQEIKSIQSQLFQNGICMYFQISLIRYS